MNRLIKTAPTKELRDLFYTLMNSPPLSEEQSAYVNEIVDEIEKREKSPYTNEDYSYLRIFAKYDLIRETLPQKATPIEVIFAVFEHSTDEELQRLRAGFMGIGDYYRETIEAFTEQGESLTGRDAEPPRTKPKPRRRFHPALIAASVGIALFLVNTVAAYAGFNPLAVLARWSQDAMYIIFGEPGENIEISPVYYRLYDVLNELGIEVDLPRFAPGDTKFRHIEPEEPTDYLPIFAWFHRGDGEYSISINPTDGVSTFSELNDGGQSGFYHKGKYRIESNMYRLVAVWIQNGYEIRIQGDLTYGELTKILDSI
jgi:hypothetical protein